MSSAAPALLFTALFWTVRRSPHTGSMIALRRAQTATAQPGLSPTTPPRVSAAPTVYQSMNWSPFPAAFVAETAAAATTKSGASAPAAVW